MTPREPDDRALADMANEQLSRRDVIWVCPYCYNEVGHEPTRPCCGEMGHEIAVDTETGDPVDEEDTPAPVPLDQLRRYVRMKYVQGGMDPNPNGHMYGCECSECMDFYRSLK